MTNRHRLQSVIHQKPDIRHHRRYLPVKWNKQLTNIVRGALHIAGDRPRLSLWTIYDTIRLFSPRIFLLEIIKRFQNFCNHFLKYSLRNILLNERIVS